VLDPSSGLGKETTETYSILKSARNFTPSAQWMLKGWKEMKSWPCQFIEYQPEVDILQLLQEYTTALVNVTRYGLLKK